jgi:hypothetical protein
MLAGVPHYLEIAVGTHAGHRFDIAATGSAGPSLVLDLSSPGSTLATVPSDLVGMPVIIRPHRTLGECYPIAQFQGSGDPANSDQLQFHTPTGYQSFFLLDVGPYRQWTDVTDGGIADAGSTVLRPGTGLFVNNRGASIDLLQTGEVRFHDFVQALNEDLNLVAEAFPIPTSSTSRGTLLSDGFFGATDPANADQIQLWRANTDPALNGYQTYFLLDAGAGTGLQYWVESSDASIANQNNTPLFQPDRATFFKIEPSAGHPSYRVPAPWTP